MKRLGWVLVGLFLLGSVAVGATYPAVGDLSFKLGAAAEARVYGLQNKVVSIGEWPVTIYDSGPAAAKQTLVLLHGYSADKEVWPRFARHLLQDYRVIIPDLAGHGETGFKSDADYSTPAQARRVAALMDALGIPKAHIAGNSMGGFIAAHFALAYPDRTLSIALIDPAGVTSPQPSDMEKMLAQGRNPFEVTSRADFNEFYAMTMAQPPWLPDFVLAAMARQYQIRRPELAKIFSDFSGKDLLDQKLAEIRAPALLIWGGEDRLIHVSSAAVWAAGLPNDQVIIEDGIGHMPMVERPAETAQQYREFLTRVTH